MGILLLLPFLLLLMLPGQDTPRTNDGSAVVVLSSKWARSHQAVEKLDEPVMAPAAAMLPANKNFERNRRTNDPAGVRDPNADSLDGRSAALEKSVQEARAPKPKAVDGYAYRVKVQNASAKIIEVMFWEYQFKEKANPANVVRRQFLCGVNIKPDKDKELQAFSVSGPSDVISVGSLRDKSEDLFEERVVVNRVEYADGTIWQRKDWNYAEVKLGIARAIGTPWGTEMCRSL
ncbi:MAG: hypothetical protein QOF02_4040 [Blastocatellia bacterium]|jgi:hypothetical protein|nr:hypothetical protein [Blastocatellia bacterium]